MPIMRFVALCAGFALILQSAACGTILHPERKGQKDGKIDAGVAVLDAIGLLFFIIPGVIAFAVDFSNGTIYLPGGKKASFDPKGDDAPRRVERALRETLGVDVRLDGKDVQRFALRSLDELPPGFAVAAR